MTSRSLALGLRIALFAAPLVAADIPRPAPEFTVHMVDGSQVQFSQYRGKVLAVEFLQTTCPHCQNCSIIMNRVYKEFAPKGFQALGVAFNDMARMLVPDYISQLQLTFPVGIGVRDEVISFLQHPTVEILYVPQLVFIDRKGIVRAQFQGRDDFFRNEEANMRAQVQALLDEPVGKSRGGKPKAAVKPSSFSARKPLE